VWSSITRRIASGSKPTAPVQAAIRQSSPTPDGGADAGREDSSSHSDETDTSDTTAGPFAQPTGSTADSGGSGDSQLDGERSANGRVSKCRRAMSTFSSTLYPDSSITRSHWRTGAGILSGSVAVTIHNAADRSNETSMYASSKARRRCGSSTSSSTPATSASTTSIPSRMKTGLLTPASLRPAMMRPEPPSSVPWSKRQASCPPSITCTWGRPSAAAAATASDVLPTPDGPARHGTGDADAAGRTTSASGAPPAATSRPASAPSTVSRPLLCGQAASASTSRDLARP